MKKEEERERGIEREKKEEEREKEKSCFFPQVFLVGHLQPNQSSSVRRMPLSQLRKEKLRKKIKIKDKKKQWI